MTASALSLLSPDKSQELSTVMAVTRPPLSPTDIVLDTTPFSKRLAKIRLSTEASGHTEENLNWRRGTLILENWRVSYYFIPDIYVVIWVPISAGPFTAVATMKAVTGFLKQVSKGKGITPQVLEKKYFDIHWALSRILEGTDVSIVDIDKCIKTADFVTETHKAHGHLPCNHASLAECTTTCRPTPPVFHEALVDIDDLEQEVGGGPVALDISAVLNEVNSFYEKNPTAKQASSLKPSLESFGSAFNFELQFEGLFSIQPTTFLLDPVLSLNRC